MDIQEVPTMALMRQVTGMTIGYYKQRTRDASIGPYDKLSLEQLRAARRLPINFPTIL
jgi:hypothetical protein